MSSALTLDHVSKRYRLGTSQGSLRDLLASWARRVSAGPTEDPPSEHIWALRDITLELPNGAVLGVIGSNGAGKTTLLKLLSRITKPTLGTVGVHGRMSSLIELGAGFHPDLTGRENVFLNGAILGLSRKEIQARFDSIVNFAELERFIDTPVKRYSSGMYARLGFSVAAHTDPDVLVVDEVLAVGDGPFQKKCYDFIHRFVSGDKTVVFVSHNMVVIEHLCSQVLWIDRGHMKMLAPPERVLPSYFDAMDRQMVASGTKQEGGGAHLRLYLADVYRRKGSRTRRLQHWRRFDRSSTVPCYAGYRETTFLPNDSRARRRNTNLHGQHAHRWPGAEAH